MTFSGERPHPLSATKTLFNYLQVRSSDRPVLAYLAPVFALVTAVNVLTMSFSKALFVVHNPYAALPWMFMGAATFTLVVTLLYVGILQRWSATLRMQGLLVIAAASYAIIAALTRVDPAGISLVVFAWCAGIGSLLMVQIWAWSSTLLPTRQARRLFPISSAVATLGAAAGGALTRAVVFVGGMTLLLFVASALLVVALIIVDRARRRVPELATTELPKVEASAAQVERMSALAQIGTALSAMRKIPLLAHLAILAFLVQIASVVMDFQFMSALKSHYDGDGMASFLGIYYFAANLLTLFVALFVAARFTRFGGIGVAASSAPLVLMIGSGLTLALGYFGLGLAFVSIVATSLAERVAGFGIAKQAVQAAIMPVPSRLAEPARFVEGGVMTRLAVIVVSGGFLIVGHDLANYRSLSPLLVATAAAALLVGFRVGPSYRKALLDALVDKRGGGIGDGEIPDWARVEAQRIVSKLLATASTEGIRRGLSLCRELRVPPPPRVVQSLLESEDPRVVAEALEGLQDQPMVPRKITLARLLDPSRPAEVLSGALAVLPHAWTEFGDLVRPLMAHADETVSSRAVIWLRASVLGPVTRQVIRKRVQVQTGVSEMEQLARGMATDVAGPRTIAHKERSLGTLTRRFMGLVDRLPRLLASGDPKKQRIALDLFVDLALPEHVNLLVESLEQPGTRAIAMIALSRMPEDVVYPELIERLDGPDTLANLSARVHIVQLVERMGGQRGVQLLLAQLDATTLSMRQRTVTSLWRITGGENLTLPSDAGIQGRVLHEIEELVSIAIIDSALSRRDGEHQRYLRTELALRRAYGETRIFRLLGLIYTRDAIDGAFAHYRSTDRRRRSNAIELLDTEIGDPEMRVVVNYIEGTEHRDGRSYTSSTGMMQIPAFTRMIGRFASHGREGGDPIDSLLGDIDPWMQEMYRWAVRTDSGEAPPPVGPRSEMDQATQEDVMERLFLLRGISLFDEVPADQLLPLAHVATRRTFDAGAVIFEVGEPGEELFLVARGEVLIERDGRDVATFGPRECFGEMAILDDRARSATARATVDSECLVIGRGDFDDLLDIAPGLARGVIRVLTRRLRNTLEAQR